MIKQTVIALSLIASVVSVDAKSIGRGVSVSRSFSSPTRVTSVGVSKPTITNQVAPKPTPTYSQTQSYTPQPTYQPQYSAPVQQTPNVPSNTSTFLSSMGGAVAGSAIGSMLFGNHGSGGTTVINNGTPQSTGVGAPAAPMVAANTEFNQPMTQPQKPYDIWSFIGDVIGFIILIILLGSIGWIGYTLYKRAKEKKAMVKPEEFSPNKMFWDIQKAYSSKDKEQLYMLLGSDLVDEMTSDSGKFELNLSNVSYNILNKDETEISIEYKFVDDGMFAQQVWHYELHGGRWKLNGIETFE